MFDEILEGIEDTDKFEIKRILVDETNKGYKFIEKSTSKTKFSFEWNVKGKEIYLIGSKAVTLDDETEKRIKEAVSRHTLHGKIPEEIGMGMYWMNKMSKRISDAVDKNVYDALTKGPKTKYAFN